MAFCGYLKQSTAVDLPIGPFVDSTDGNTDETTLTLTQPDIRLKKNNANWAQKNAAQTLSHEENGYYEVSLDTTDTNTLGQLTLAVHEAGALHVRQDYSIITAEAWDLLHNTVGPIPSLGIIDRGQLASVTDGSHVALRAAAAFDDNTLKDCLIGVKGSTQNYWQFAYIDSNALSGDAVVVSPAFTVTPSGGTYDYIIIAGARRPSTDLDAFADAIWDEALSGHTTGGSAGDALTDALTAANYLQSALIIAIGAVGATGNDTTHAHLAAAAQNGDDELNEHLVVIFDVSASFEAHARWISDFVGSTKLAALSTALPFTPVSGDQFAVLSVRRDVAGGASLDAAGVRSAIGLASANLDTQLSTIAGYVDTELTSIISTLTTIAGYVDTEVAAIKTRTDPLTLAAISQEVLKAVSMIAGNKLQLDTGTNEVVLYDTDGTTELGRAPFTRLGAPANPLSSVGG